MKRNPRRVGVKARRGSALERLIDAPQWGTDTGSGSERLHLIATRYEWLISASTAEELERIAWDILTIEKIEADEAEARALSPPQD